MPFITEPVGVRTAVASYSPRTLATDACHKQQAAGRQQSAEKTKKKLLFYVATSTAENLLPFVVEIVKIAYVEAGAAPAAAVAAADYESNYIFACQWGL